MGLRLIQFICGLKGHSWKLRRSHYYGSITECEYCKKEKLT